SDFEKTQAPGRLEPSRWRPRWATLGRGNRYPRSAATPTGANLAARCRCAGSTPYGVADVPGRRRTALPMCRVGVVRRCRSARSASVLGVVEPGQPGGEPLDRRLELGVGVGELLQPVAEPGQTDLLVTPAPLELLDPAIGEVHDSVVALDPVGGG